MLLWSIMTVLVGTTAVLLCAPLMRNARGNPSTHKTSNDVLVYREQLAELERDLERGIVEAPQAQSVRTEIHRRILAVGDKNDIAPPGNGYNESQLAAVAVGAIVVMGSIGLYGMVGSPHLQSSASSIPPGHTGITGTGTTRTGDTGSKATPGSLDEMIQRIRARVNAQPKDAESWRMLGWTYFATNRFDKAADAYATAVRLNPDEATWRAMYGEAIVRAAGGAVTGKALGVFKETLQRNAGEPRARFFVGLAKEQSGNKKAALEHWLALLNDAGPSADWSSDLRQRVGELAAEIGVDITDRLPTGATIMKSARKDRDAIPTPAAQMSPQHPETNGSQMRERGPTPEDIRNAQSMSTADRSAMIDAMVDGLQRRLDAAPRNPEGWIKLIRSRMVLGQTSKAASALKQAMLVFSDAPIQRKNIQAEARRLGVPQG